MNETKISSNALVYIAAGLALWGAMIGSRAVMAPASLWTWLALFGAGVLFAVAAFRMSVANHLGAAARARPTRAPSGEAAIALTRRLSTLDRSLVALVAVWMAPLVVALMTGTLER